MDFKKCSEVYGYKSIAEVEEEEMAEKLAQRDWDWIDAMVLANQATVALRKLFTLNTLQHRLVMLIGNRRFFGDE